MPLLKNVKILEAEEIWAAPDGQRTLYSVKVGTEDGTVLLKTWSKQISKVGWTGDLDTYEKEGKNGSETFAKQPQKEGGFGGFKGKPQADPFTMFLSYAKDLKVARIAAGLDTGVYSSDIQEVLAAGYELYEHRPEAGNELPKPKVHIDGDHAPSIDELNGLFPDE